MPKIIALLLLFAGALAAQEPFLKPEALTNLTCALLKGMKFAGDCSDLLRCSANIPDVTQRVQAAMGYFAAIDWNHAMVLFEGIIIVIDAARDMFDPLAPCLGSDSTFQQIVTKLANIGFAQMFKRLMANGATVFQYVTDMVTYWAGAQVYEFGMTAGVLIGLLAIDDSS